MIVAALAADAPAADRRRARRACSRRYPLLTLKVIAGIHWEALSMLAEGLRLYRRARATGRAPVTTSRLSDPR